MTSCTQTSSMGHFEEQNTHLFQEWLGKTCKAVAHMSPHRSGILRNTEDHSFTILTFQMRNLGEPGKRLPGDSSSLGVSVRQTRPRLMRRRQAPAPSSVTPHPAMIPSTPEAYLTRFSTCVGDKVFEK